VTIGLGQKTSSRHNGRRWNESRSNGSTVEPS